MFDRISFERLLEVTASDLDVISNKLGLVYTNSVDDDAKLVLLAEAFTLIHDWSSYYNRFKDVQDSKMVELSNNNSYLLAENKILNKKIYELTELVTKQNIEIGELKAKNNSALLERVDALTDLYDYIKKEAKMLSKIQGNRIKQSMATGADSNRFIQELDTEKLIQDYKDNDCVITKDIMEYYSRNYGITYNGLRDRLIKAGVWDPEPTRLIKELDTEKLIKDYKDNNYSITKEMFESYNKNYGITYNGLRGRLIKAGVWRSRN